LKITIIWYSEFFNGKGLKAKHMIFVSLFHSNAGKNVIYNFSTRSTCYRRNVNKDATSHFGSNENIFPVCQSFEAFHLVDSKDLMTQEILQTRNQKQPIEDQSKIKQDRVGPAMPLLTAMSQIQTLGKT
jgi:hypothetical protein